MTSRVHTIPPGADFLANLAEAIIDDRFGFGLPDARREPLALARLTVFLPTRRAARVLRSEIADRLGVGSAILPVVRALGEVDDDSGYFDHATPAALALDPPVGTVDAVLSLADLVIAWKSALPKAIVDHLQGAPMMAPANPADAVWLGRSLFDLMQSVEIEEADLERLDGAVDADLQEWWQITREFLRIARDYWPALLRERGQSSPAHHHNVLIDAETARIAGGAHEGPMIVAGSTGTRPSTARLIGAVARHSLGAVVLPGLDQAMAPVHWHLLRAMALAEAAQATRSDARLLAVTARNHPQYGLTRLLPHLGHSVETLADIRELVAPPPPIALRNRLVSLAMLPAAATTVWSDPAALPGSDEIRAALADVSLIEAANEREEAEALAAAMRAALEPTAGNPEPTAALVTPDRNLARRVVVELKRYGIDADDSGGTHLGRTQEGSLCRLAVEVAFAPGDPVALAALVKHPLVRFGKEAGDAARAAELVELLALRGGTGSADVDGLPALVTTGAGRRRDRHAAQWLRRIGDREVALALAHAQAIAAAFEPLLGLFGPREDALDSVAVGQLALATALTVENIADEGNGDRGGVWASEAGRALAAALDDCRHSRTDLAMSGFEWIGALEAILAGWVIRPDGGGHPRALVWGTLEARLQHVDTVLLGGLDEGTWPASTTEDPFLSRAMKAQVGLEPPERRLGQAAHDFQMALGMPRVVLSRAYRVGRAPTVASRWLQRLLAAAGEEGARAVRARGEAVLVHIRAREVVEPAPAPGRPQPRPPAERQPRSFSFSEVGTLRRDPYAVYGRRILRLDPLEPFIADPGPRERGTLYHRILERFVRDAEPAELNAERLMAIADDCFAEAEFPVEITRIWRNRLARAAGGIVRWEAERAPEISTRFIETYGRLTLLDGTELRGIADRIDRHPDGTASIIDYKTGSSPSVRIARALLDPQLALEAHVLSQGGFGEAGPMPVRELLYVRLTGKEKFVERVDKAPKKPDEPDQRAAVLAERAVRELTDLVAALRSGERGFMSRVIARSARDFTGDYDHLARVAEWQVAIEDGAEGGDG